MEMGTTQRYCEGGWGWFVVLSAFVAQFLVFGTMKGLGVLLHAVSEDFETELWILGSINSLHYGVHFVLSPLTSAIARKVGNRYVAAFGSILYGLGLTLASVSDSIGLYSVMLVLVAGTGAACVLDMATAEVAFYFRRKFALTIIFIVAGSPIGTVVYGPLMQVLLVTYGWRGAMLLTGGIGFNLVWAAMLLRRPKDSINSYKPLPVSDATSMVESDSKTSDSPNKQTSTNPSLIKYLTSTMGLHIFRNVSFILLASNRMLYCTAYGGVLVYMVPNAMAIGLEVWEASLTTVAFGVGGLIGGLFGGLIGLFPGALKLRSFNISFCVAVLTSGGVLVLALAASPFVPTFPGQLGTVFVVGVAMHLLISVSSVMFRNLPFGDDMYVIVLGWSSFLTGISASVGDVMSGWLFDLRHDFIGTYFLYSAVMAASLLCLWIEILRAYARA